MTVVEEDMMKGPARVCEAKEKKGDEGGRVPNGGRRSSYREDLIL